MKLEKKAGLIILAVITILSILLPLTGCGGPSFPYQGAYSGNWNGQLTMITRSIPVGGNISINVDEKGVCSGTVATTGGTISPATMKAQVDSTGNLTGTVTFTINGTAFDSSWTGKITGSDKSLSLQGNWTSQHGSGTFSGTGNNSK